MEFIGFQKMPRLSRDVIISEKIDGTNAQIAIEEMNGFPIPGAIYEKDGLSLFAGSKNRWLTIENDNYGFAKWAKEHGEELLQLGPGRHFGEWWGQGIQRGYGLKEKRFSLFNVSRWNDETKPECCHVVPVLWKGTFNTEDIDACLKSLERRGSEAAPGYTNPEGIVIYHTAGNFSFKKTIEKDDVPKTKELFNEPKS